MIKPWFICGRCDESFEISVLEPGEAEEKRVQPVPVKCPKCGGDLQRIEKH